LQEARGKISAPFSEGLFFWRSPACRQAGIGTVGPTREGLFLCVATSEVSVEIYERGEVLLTHERSGRKTPQEETGTTSFIQKNEPSELYFRWRSGLRTEKRPEQSYAQGKSKISNSICYNLFISNEALMSF
jgi:hypothetical protein